MDLSALFSTDNALAATVSWVALAPHLGRELVISEAQMVALGAIGHSLWQERTDLDRRFGEDLIDQLLTRGLLIDQGNKHAKFRERDEHLRAHHWRPLSATTHVFSRWEGVRTDQDPTLSRFANLDEMIANYGPPPPEVIEFTSSAQSINLPPPQTGRLDDVLMQRYTGRNFDGEAHLSLDATARLLHRCFGAQHRHELRPGTFALKKTSPSGGGLHPIEAYVLVQRIEGVEPGLYHYHPVRHALEPMQKMGREEAAELAVTMVANQEWFANAPMLVVMAARVARNTWKYRNHAKTYRVLHLDAGHLSQTFYLLAAEMGMPAFITAGINEVDIERALGLDPISDAVIAICGCGPAAAEYKTFEFKFGVGADQG